MNTFMKINESLKKYGNIGNVEEIYSLGEIDIFDIKKKSFVKVSTSDIIMIVDDALRYMKTKYPYLHLYLQSYKIMYIPVYPSQMCNTMCVDNNNNLWINMNFVYNDCGMNKDRVFGILFHEMFHIFLGHLIRFNKMFPEETKKMMTGDMWRVANQKANLAMDYEINASMVADGVVTKGFFEIMNGLYNEDYYGYTWEEIYTKFGDDEYRKWKEAMGERISEEELKILEAIEEAAKILKDPDATDMEKAKARRELQKKIDKILNRESEEDIQDILEEMKDTRLSDFGEIGQKMQDVIDDLYKSPDKMTKDQFDNLMEDINQMADEMSKNASEIADTFKKTDEDVLDDIENMRKTLKDAVSQMRNGKMSKEEKEDIADAIKDSLEDVISSDIAKKKNKEKRKERDEMKAAKRKEAFKASHPLRKLINIFKNLMHLGEEPYDLVCSDSYDIMSNIVEVLDSLTEQKMSDTTDDDIEVFNIYLPQLKDSLFTDLKRLLENKTIIHKTEDDLHKVLDDAFGVIDKFLLVDLINPKLTDDEKITILQLVIRKLRLIGKILKTQKSWRASEEFKEGYREKRDELMSLFKKDKKATLKALYDMGLIDATTVMTLDKRSKALYDELVADGEIK